jgi:imidazoleglycerol-phosphate dehydratase
MIGIFHTAARLRKLYKRRMTTNRTSTVSRQTAETKIELKLSLDGSGQNNIHTGVGFLDHMLVLLARHALIDLDVHAVGDLQVDAHHTTEDIGICLGQAIAHCLGAKNGIRRYGHMVLPMEETLVTSAIDFSGRPYLVFEAPMPSPKIGDFDSELVEDFWQGFASNAMCNLHILLHHGRNTHHIAEAIFKATARAIRIACEIDPRQTGVPSSKGVL